jgi:AcrR family transcriptional regulator
MATEAASTRTMPATEGLRERKKRQTRELISSTATKMFLERGFDAVKVVDIARACDVAEKTVFNYFPTKESLLLDREQEMADSIRAALGPGATAAPIAAATELLGRQLEGILAPVPRGRAGVTTLRRFIELLESTPSLRAAQRELDARLVAVAATAMAERARLHEDEPEVQMAAQAILGLWRIQFAALRRYVAQGVPVGQDLRDKVAMEVGRAARLIDSGIWPFASAVVAPGDRHQLELAAVAAQRSAKQVVTAIRKASRGR